MSNTGAKRPLSLTLRMMGFVALTIGLSLSIISQLVLHAVQLHFVEQDADELKVANQAILQRLKTAGTPEQDLSESLSHAVSGHHGVYFLVQNAQGYVVYATPGANLSAATDAFAAVERVDISTLQMWQSGSKTYRGVVVQRTIGNQSYRITTAMDMGFHQQFLQSFQNSLMLIMTLAGLATLLAAWFGLHQGLAPLRQLSTRVRSIEADRLDMRLDSSAVPTELQELVLAFNQMIDGLEQSFTRLSHFSADIAHELRTPLTCIITQTQVGLGQTRTLEEYRELLYSNLEEQERMAKMVNDMLWLAKSDHGLLKPVFGSVDLGREINDLYEFFEALAEDKQVALVKEGSAPPIRGDRALLRQAISNLLSNALRHTPAGQQVLITLGEIDENQIFIRVQNPGNTISTEQLPKLFDRFYRADPSRQRHGEGAGLGLAIVKSIVECHGGNVEAYSDHGTTRFTIKLPCTLAVPATP